MRHLVVLLVVAASTTLVPTWAVGGNQDVAEKIAANLREGGQLAGYRIGVKYQDGTAWLRGTVRDQTQLNSAMNLVLQTPGVTRVVNDLEIAELTPPSKKPGPVVDSTPIPPAGLAEPVGTSFEPTPATPASAMELAPVPTPTLALGSDVEPERVPRMIVSRPMPVAYSQGAPLPVGQPAPTPAPRYVAPMGNGVAPVRYDQPHVPNYSWPSYAAHPNYAALTYPKQHSPCAWPYVGPFYPYPQVPLGWRKVTLEWHDGWWQLDFDDGSKRGLFSGLFRPK